VEEIVNILHRDFEVFQPELKRERRRAVEIIASAGYAARACDKTA